MYKTISGLLILALGTWVGGAIPSLTSFPRIVAQVALTNQTGSIPATTLVTPTKSALYRVSVYMVQVFPQNATCSDCGDVYASFQWTDDGGTQLMGDFNGTGCCGGPNSLSTPFNLQLYPTGGDGTHNCSAAPCFPFLFPGSAGLPGGTFLARANAGTPLIYSVTLFGNDGNNEVYDYFMTVEQLE
jgi:hypothetical protein